jgi:hypothetical protein
MKPVMIMHLTMVVVAGVYEVFSREFREFSKTGPETPEKRLFGEKCLY